MVIRLLKALILILPISLSGLESVVRAQPPEVVFLEPVDQDISGGGLSTYRILKDSSRVETYRSWLGNEPADWALDLYQQAIETSSELNAQKIQPSTYYIALVPGGNHADIGFRLMEGDKVTDYPEVAYIKLGPDEWRFDMTLLHETGHVVLAVLNAGMKLPKKQMAAISHTTAALTDRKTAFDEGYAIHLETLLAHLSEEQFVRNKYKHEQFLFGFWPGMLSEYYRPSDDLMTFSQTRARYLAVRENTFAFESAFQGPDYLRVQLENSRDFATLRSANQLLQSEGFYASFFYSLLMRGKTFPSREQIRKRQKEILRVLAQMFVDIEESADTPYLLHFVLTYRELYPELFTEVLHAFLDLSRGVFVDRHAPMLWRDLYLAALRLDLDRLNLGMINEQRERWQVEVERDLQILYSRIGPQIRCTIPSAKVELVALETIAPVSFDINTVQEGILRLIPGITLSEIQSWMYEREERPFISVQDFRRRIRLSDEAWTKLHCEE